MDTLYDMLLVLDPVLKLRYLNVAWEKKYLSAGIESFKAQVICLLFIIGSTNKYFLVSCLQGKV